MNNLKLFQATFRNTEAPARSLSLEFAKRPDAEIGNEISTPQGETLGKRLENAGKLRKEKLITGVKAKEALKRLAETTPENNWEKVADNLHTLSEWHKKKVGSALKIGEDKYLLIHLSEGDLQLVLAEHKGKSPEDLKAELTKLGIKYDAEPYTKDKIPTVEPIDTYTEEDFPVTLSPKAIAALNYNSNLETVNAGLRQQPEVASPAEILAGKHRSKYEVAIQHLYGGKGNIPVEIARVFNLSGEINADKLKADPEYAKKVLDGVFRAGSTSEFQAKVRAAQEANKDNASYSQALEETLAAFKVMDITYGNVNRGDSLEKRLITMENGANKLPGLKGFSAQKLFADPDKGVGVDTNWQEFYAKPPTPEKSKLNKIKIESILNGGEVQMLRVDRETHGSKNFKAFIDRMPGGALKNSLDVPQTVRGEKEYVYKYQALSGAEAQAAIANYRKNHSELEKFLAVLSPEQITQSFKVAQVEIPNCENPAIVVQPKFKEIPVPAPVATQEAVKCRQAISVIRAFRNVPGGFSLIFRPLDWFTPDSEKNYLADPAILDKDGKVLRESEYLNASKRLDIKYEKRLNNEVNDIAKKGSQTVSEFLKAEVMFEGNKTNNAVAADILMRGLGAEMRKAEEGKTPAEAFTARATALKEWRETSKKIGCSNRLIQLAEFMYQENFDTKGLAATLDRENTAFSLLKFKEKWGETLAGNRREKDKDKGPLTFTDLEKELPQAYKELIAALEKATGLPKENFTLLGSREVNKVIEEALYGEKLNIKHPPEFVGDFVVIPPHQDGKINMYHLGAGLDVKNVSSPFNKMLQLALAASSFLLPTPLYLKTSTGIPDDLVEKYIEKIKENNGDVKSIFGKDGAPSFEEFVRFMRTGEVDCGQKVISIPINEVRLLIPGWNMLSKLVGGSGGSTSCPTVSAGGDVLVGAGGGGA